MRTEITRTLVAATLTSFCSVAYGDLPPTEPPDPLPVTSVPKLLGTWEGPQYTVHPDGYSWPDPQPCILKITDQVGNRFRGWQVTTSGNLLALGTIEDDGTVNVLVDAESDVTWRGRLTLGPGGRQPARIEFHIVLPQAPRIHTCTVTKTTP